MLAFVLEGDAIRKTSSYDDLAQAYASGHRVWVDLEERGSDGERVLSDLFKIHPLAIEDVWADLEQPKVDDFGTYLHVIVHAVRQGKSAADLELHELDLILGPNFVCTHTKDPKICAHVRDDLARMARLLKRGTPWVAHSLLDRIVDDYIPLIDAFEDEIAEVEADVVEKAGTPGGNRVMRRIFALKRALQLLRRTGLRQREILLRLSRAEFDEIGADAVPFFRDVYDHFSRVTDLADSYRELLTSTLDAFLSVQSNRMNEVMKTLTLMSTIMLPLTFVAGVYGMNFEHMPELKWLYGYPFALGLMAAIAIGILYFFRRRRWL